MLPARCFIGTPPSCAKLDHFEFLRIYFVFSNNLATTTRPDVVTNRKALGGTENQPDGI